MELEKTKAEQADVYIYLHKKLDDNFDVIASLESKIEELTTDRQRYEQAATRELATTKRTAEQTISGLQQTVEELTDKLEALTEFKEKKDEIEARLAKCLAELEAERELRQSQVAELDRRNVAAKDKLKKEMFLKIKETKQVGAVLVFTTAQAGHSATASSIRSFGPRQACVGGCPVLTCRGGVW